MVEAVLEGLAAAEAGEIDEVSPPALPDKNAALEADGGAVEGEGDVIGIRRTEFPTGLGPAAIRGVNEDADLVFTLGEAFGRKNMDRVETVGKQPGERGVCVYACFLRFGDGHGGEGPASDVGAIDEPSELRGAGVRVPDGGKEPETCDEGGRGNSDRFDERTAIQKI